VPILEWLHLLHGHSTPAKCAGGLRLKVFLRYFSNGMQPVIFWASFFYWGRKHS
jgi:hypothetical protein